MLELSNPEPSKYLQLTPGSLNHIRELTNGGPCYLEAAKTKLANWSTTLSQFQRVNPTQDAPGAEPHGLTHCNAKHINHSSGKNPSSQLSCLNDWKRCDPFLDVQMGTFEPAEAHTQVSVRWENCHHYGHCFSFCQSVIQFRISPQRWLTLLRLVIYVPYPKSAPVRVKYNTARPRSSPSTGDTQTLPQKRNSWPNVSSLEHALDRKVSPWTGAIYYIGTGTEDCWKCGLNSVEFNNHLWGLKFSTVDQMYLPSKFP